MERKMKKGFLLLVVLLITLSIVPVAGLAEGTERTLYFVDDDGNMLDSNTFTEDIKNPSFPLTLTVPEFENTSDEGITYQWYAGHMGGNLIDSANTETLKLQE